MSGYRTPEARGPVRPSFVGITLAGLAAGPLVMMMITAMIMIEEAVRGREFDATVLAGLPFFVMLSFIVGVLPGFLLSGIGTLMMLWLERKIAPARSLWAWMAAGAVLPLAPASAIFGLDPLAIAFTLSFALPGAVCGAICWRFERPSPAA